MSEKERERMREAGVRTQRRVRAEEIGGRLTHKGRGRLMENGRAKEMG